MRQLFFILTVFFILTNLALGQVDTLTCIRHGTEKKCKGKKCKYWVDNKSATQTEYEQANAESKIIGKCKPCWLKLKDKDGRLLYEGDFHTDCCIGTYIERYDNGQLKVKGQYKVPKNGNLEKLYDNGYCRREGEWIYYKKNGDIEKTETYKDGELIK